MSQSANEFLESCRPEGVASFERLIRKMTEAGCSKLVLNDHPDYDFNLGVSAADAELAGIEHPLPIIANFGERYDRFRGVDDDDDDDEEESYIDEDQKWDWFRECWLAAGGKESGKTVVLFANGLGDMMDLNSGEEPDDELGIHELIWP